MNCSCCEDCGGWHMTREPQKRKSSDDQVVRLWRQ